MPERQLFSAVIERTRSWFRGRLFARLIAASFTLLVVHSVVASLHTYQLERHVMEVNVDAFARKLAESTAASWASAVIEQDYAELDNYTKAFVQDSDQFAFVRVELADGRTASQWPRPKSRERPDLTTLHIFSAPIRVNGAASPGTVHLGVPFGRWEAELQGRVVTHFLEYAAALGCIAGAMYWMLQRMIGRPLRLLDEQVQRLGTGNLETSIPVTRSDELGRLAGTLERMREHLKTSYAALGEQNSRLLALDKVKTEFLANMSHEIRTPLNSIIGCTEFLGDRDLGPDDRTVYVDILRRNGSHLLALVNDILDYSKLETGHMVLEPRPTDLRALCAEVVACVKPRVGQKPVQLELVVADRVPHCVEVDPVRLRQILLNVVDNAVKFTSVGSVSIEVDHAALPPARLTIVVRDTGIGIAKEALERLFRPFTQADTSTTRRFGGTGLGLMISRKLAELLGGSLALQSEPGRGSTVTLTLAAPEVLAPKVQEPVPAAKSSAGPLRGRVLVVEDGLDNQRLVRAMLERAGFGVEIAPNGQVGCERALAVANTDSAFDLILMDLQMPVMDGITATQNLRSAGLATPIVALTANALGEERDRCLAAGCSAFTTKPISRDRLLEVVREHVSRVAAQ